MSQRQDDWSAITGTEVRNYGYLDDYQLIDASSFLATGTRKSSQFYDGSLKTLRVNSDNTIDVNTLLSYFYISGSITLAAGST